MAIVSTLMAFLTIPWGYQVIVISADISIYVVVMAILQVLEYTEMKKQMREHNQLYLKVSAKSFDQSQYNVMSAYLDDNEQQP